MHCAPRHCRFAIQRRHRFADRPVPHAIACWRASERGTGLTASNAGKPLRGFGGAVQTERQNVCSITEYHRFFGSQGFGKLKFCYNARMSFDELDLTPSALETLRREAAQRPDYID